MLYDYRSSRNEFNLKYYYCNSRRDSRYFKTEIKIWIFKSHKKYFRDSTYVLTCIQMYIHTVTCLRTCNLFRLMHEMKRFYYPKQVPSYPPIITFAYSNAKCNKRIHKSSIALLDFLPALDTYYWECGHDSRILKFNSVTLARLPTKVL